MILGLGAGIYFFLQDEPVAVEEAASDGAEPVLEDDEEKKEIVEKVYIYRLGAFFLPLLADGVETGKFISVTPNLKLSNATLFKEVTKVKPLIRKNIYIILKRKSPDDYLKDKIKTKEQIKREILTASNALLLSGTGTINDVFFTKFIVK